MPTSDWAVTSRTVAGPLRSRTVDGNSVEQGDFTNGDQSTRPTKAQVEELIVEAEAEIGAIIGTDIPAAFWDIARKVTGLTAALEVELSFFPQEVGAGTSPYAELKVQRDEKLKQLMDAISEAAGEASDSTVDGAGSPSYSFPEDVGGMVGWGTEF
jgi:hypothetical protein